MNRISLIAVLAFTSGVANANSECEILLSSKTTMAQFVSSQDMKAPGTRMDMPKTIENPCFPHSVTKTFMSRTQPVCMLNGKTPVSAIFATAETDPDKIDAVMYSMRGTHEDIDATIEYLNQYKDVSQEFVKTVKGPHYFGWMKIWKNGDQYIILGQHEPGYDKEYMSLHMTIGTKEGIENTSKDWYTCKQEMSKQ